MKKYSKVIFNFGQLLIGIALSTMAMACFALPYGMVVSGVTGVSRTINFFTGTGITPIVYILNIGFFVIGAVALGKKFAASIAVGTFAYPIFLQFFQGIESLQYLVEDPLVAAICAGILDGVGIGMVIRIGGSTGGIEIPPLILHKKFGWKVPPVLLAIDILVFLSQLPFTKTNGVILGILYAIIYSIVMDKVLLVNQGGVQLIIFSQNSFGINEKLLEMGYGTTILQGVGGYLRERNDVIYSVVGNRAVNGVKNAILEIDENAFITISSVNEVKGNGFTNYLKDEDYIADVDKRNPGKI
ncbi:MAG: YitT family protein [Clostridiales bacterium]|nr:YitT family protein [Clostridiales bacterium]